ncbi:hypothetical protein KBY82_04370 [Cyanobium sp. AMD-g]|uniref:hypothetical protein n=1 Tax=Cyanobium sp. AMD-g TaxID=2823699 RepID=UPI0020CD5A3E|nr:hypothetical protein [Cyanobium sp. AMD-g]MCP9930015.1 hypothetical protein [Cyanobium sp. AMD-g]
MAAALIGGAGAALSAGSAQAQAVANLCPRGSYRTTFNDWAASTTGILCGDKLFTYKNSTNLANIAGTDVEFDFVGDNYLFNLDFSPVSSVASFTLDYEVAIQDSTKFFAAVDIDSNVPSFAPSESLVATYTGGTNPVVLSSINGVQNPAVLPVLGQPTILQVSNVYNSGGAGGQIDSFENSFQQGTKVPGPLPVLGAGVAFGFSRKLRRRIDGARVKA